MEEAMGPFLFRLVDPVFVLGIDGEIYDGR